MLEQRPASPRDTSGDQMRSKWPGPANPSVFDGSYSSLSGDRVPYISHLWEEGHVLSWAGGCVHDGKAQQPGFALW